MNDPFRNHAGAVVFHAHIIGRSDGGILAMTTLSASATAGLLVALMVASGSDSVSAEQLVTARSDATHLAALRAGHPGLQRETGATASAAPSAR